MRHPDRCVPSGPQPAPNDAMKAENRKLLGTIRGNRRETTHVNTRAEAQHVRMTGRTSRSTVTCRLLVSLCLCESVVARPRSLASEPSQNQTESQDVEAVRVAAKQGNAEAQRTLGRAHLQGDGVAQDDAEAMRWFRLAADQGLAPAQRSLGTGYAVGRGVPQDYCRSLPVVPPRGRSGGRRRSGQPWEHA